MIEYGRTINKTLCLDSLCEVNNQVYPAPIKKKKKKKERRNSHFCRRCGSWVRWLRRKNSVTPWSLDPQPQKSRHNSLRELAPNLFDTDSLSFYATPHFKNTNYFSRNSTLIKMPFSDTDFIKDHLGRHLSTPKLNTRQNSLPQFLIKFLTLSINIDRDISVM